MEHLHNITLKQINEVVMKLEDQIFKVITSYQKETSSTVKALSLHHGLYDNNEREGTLAVACFVSDLAPTVKTPVESKTRDLGREIQALIQEVEIANGIIIYSIGLWDAHNVDGHILEDVYIAYRIDTMIFV